MGDDEGKKTGERIRDAIMNFTSPGGFAERALNSTMHVVEQLGLGIVAGEYPQGTLIPFDPDLEEMFGVSRTVVREAKKILVAKGLLESKAKVGTRVRPATEWSMFDIDVLRWHASLRQQRGFLKELFEIRLVFEPAAAAMAARRAGPEECRSLEELVRALSQATTRREFIAADLEFHTAILGMTRNRFMHSLGDLVQTTLITLLEREVDAQTTFRSPEELAHSAAKHRAIVQAIADRDPDRAEAAMKLVIHGAETSLIS
ncbi:FadR/GntR family transcriptional regulator [Tropicimonas isoalkanivorans]|uniref:Transcriptional regulator, GntR family n=1 Tax=Tropicimonas isoalkanivorans TaxID=441112 RepID=A0A1I1MQ70_9RHOB|nr:FadR/GntR family transcriptional regulator [Tropicimonas isoalkanivorans]SFC87509.1 transcriptional regulator, GntR family [Tropicimonas isoalkanivorans]